MLSHLVPSEDTCGHPSLRYAISNPLGSTKHSSTSAGSNMASVDTYGAFVSHSNVLKSTGYHPHSSVSQQLINLEEMSQFSSPYNMSKYDKSHYQCDQIKKSGRGSVASSVDIRTMDDATLSSKTHDGGHSNSEPKSHIEFPLTHKSSHIPYVTLQTSGKRDNVTAQPAHRKTSQSDRVKVTTASRYDSRNCCFCCISKQSTKGNNSSPSESNDNSSKVGSVGTERMRMEEVRNWGESFDHLMSSTSGREIFREFLKSEYSEENILFWLACEDLRKERNQELIEEKARLIYEDYISILSPKEVSLDSRAREVINANMMQPSLNTFDEAQAQIYTLMQRDSYPRFISSKIYRECLNNAVDSADEERNSHGTQNPL